MDVKRFVKKHQEQNILFYKSKNIPTSDNIIQYKKYKNKLTNILRSAERTFYTEQLNVNKSDLKKTWKIIKDMIGLNYNSNKKIILDEGDHRITSDIEICNVYRSFPKFRTNLFITITFINKHII